MSESEQMYLITIARLCEEIGNCSAPLSRLAAELGVLPVSANQMVKKLEDEGLVQYVPYHGVSLTPAGQQIAQKILRCRRLWQVFLVERLGYSVGEADVLSCRLEHVFPEEAAERLAVYLGQPASGPDGYPIPPAGDRLSTPSGINLSSIQPGQEVTIRDVRLESQSRSFLESEGITSGAKIELSAASDSGALLVRTRHGRSVNLSPGLAAGIWVDPPMEKTTNT
jgi:DtxR family Mn-dependent transcriptional regulator